MPSLLNPHVCKAPPASAVNVKPPLTSTGVPLGAFCAEGLPVPSYPFTLLPQQYARPTSVSPQE